MSSNSNSISDIHGDYPDWLELFNGRDSIINLKGFGLSDDEDEKMKWTFPDVNISPGKFLLVYASGKDIRTPILHWETVVDWGDEWNYKSDNAETPANWYEPGFNDSEWQSGKSGIGFGDFDDSTYIGKTVSLYTRKIFIIDDIENIAEALLHVDFDDGFVAYINGVEIARSNLGALGTAVAWDQVADAGREATIYTGEKPEAFQIESFNTILQNGENTIAIAVHNRSAGSSDLTLIPFLSFALYNEPENPKGSAEILDLKPQLLHTNFKIKQDGEYLSLCNPQKQIIDEVDERKILTDISWGRKPDGSENWFLFDKPTPGKSNTSNGLTDIAKDPEFNISSGFFDGPIDLELITESVANIYYTTNGDEPTINSQKYSNLISVDSTMVIKAKTIDPNLLTSNTIINTYFINEPTELAVISLSTEPENLWNDTTGIYVTGTNGISGYCSSSPRNWNQDWERPAHIEFYEPNREPGFELDCGIKIGGACSRLYPQKTLAVYTRSEYGFSKIKYQLFQDKDIEEFNNMNIRNGGQDWWRAIIRDPFMHQVVAGQMDVDWQSYRPVSLFINGEYWGIHGLREKHNEHYIAENYNIDPDSIDILKSNASLVQGTATHYNQMMNYIKTNNMNISDNYEYIKTQMDVNNYIDYQIAEIYFANIDWPGGNIKYWRPQTDDGKWRWILFDTDLGFGAHGMGQYSSNSLANATSPTSTYYANPSWSTLLFRKLLENDTFKNEFAQRYCVHIGTTFDSYRVRNILDSLYSLVVDEIPRHRTRWSESQSYGGYDWQGHIEIMEEFAILRPKSARSHLATKFNLDNSSSIVIITDPTKGIVKINGVKVLESITKLRLFDDIPTQFKAEAKPYNNFLGWRGAVNSSEDSISISFSGNDTIYANFGSATSIDDPQIASTFNLYNNYPNPFNPTTTITYEISKESKVILSIYNNVGDLIETLVDNYQQSGHYSVIFNASNHSSGVYFYKIKVNNQVKSKKCLLLK